MNTIQKNAVAVLNYQLLTTDGELIDKGEDLAYIHGHDNLLAGMEKALEGKTKGDQLNVDLDPEDAFGNLIEEANPIRIHRTQFGKDFNRLEAGMAIPVNTEDGRKLVLYVQSKKGSYVSLTRNHPLAGLSLVFNANIVNIRCALPEEIANGTAFGADGNNAPSSCSCC